MSDRAVGRSWLRPWWWERQDDPSDPAWTPTARVTADAPVADPVGLVAPVDVTHREVAVVGTLSGGDVGLVDPRGLVQLTGRSWSLDWLIGADDGWHAPARSSGVRRRTVDGMPVVETEVRVAGGPVTQRVYAARAGADDVVVVEVHNGTPVAIGIAFAVRPFTAAGAGAIASVVLDGTTVLVDGLVAAELPTSPGRWAGGDAVAGDSAEAVLAGDALEPPVGEARCDHGVANATYVVPLPHTATTRVVLPIDRAATTVRVTDALPPADAVASGWVGQLDRSVRLGLPPGAVADRVREAQAAVLLAAGAADLRFVPDRRPEPAEEAAVLGALDAFGLHDEAARLLVDLEERLALDGYLGDRSGRWDANGALLAALGAHCRLADDRALADALVGPIAKAAHWVERRRRPRRARQAPRVDGLLPDGPGPRWCGGAGAWFRDVAWSVAGLAAAADLLDTVGQDDASVEVRGLAEGLEAEVAAAMAVAATGADGAVPPQPGLPTDRRAPASLEPLVLVPGVDPDVVARTLDAVADRSVTDGLVREPASGGLSPWLTAWLALAAAGPRRSRAAQHLRAAAVAGPGAGAWPEVVHPGTGGGAAGDRWHAPSAALLLLAVRRLLLAEPDGCWWERTVATPPGVAAPGPVLDLLTALPADWLGAGIEVHGLPTSIGLASYAVRWHGVRPALLWELTPHAGAAAGPEPVLVSSGLDPDWSARGWSGEALLAPPVVEEHDHTHDHEHDQADDRSHDRDHDHPGQVD